MLRLAVVKYVVSVCKTYLEKPPQTPKLGDSLTEVKGPHVVLKGHMGYTVLVKIFSRPPKTFSNIFTQVKYISMEFCQFVASLQS